MIQRAEASAVAERAPRSREVAFATVWSTGPDARRDPVFRLQAHRRRGDGFERFDAWCRPFAGDTDEGATLRMKREFGVTSADLEGAGAAEDAWAELLAFLEGALVVVPDRADFEARARVAGFDGGGREAVGLLELSEALSPGRSSRLGEDLVDHLVPRSGSPRRAVGPREVQAAAGALVGAFLELPPAVAALAVHGYGKAAERLRDAEPRVARALERILDLAGEPGAWADGGDDLFPPHPGLRAGRLAGAAAEHRDLAAALRAIEPRWTTPDDEPPPLPPEPIDVLRLEADDLRRLDEIFEHHLPHMFGGDSYREGQHAVAREVGTSLGAGGMLLVHAPTGTGKTLAYLVPAAMWAARNGARLGVATFTRALQEQAMDREVPLALELLRRSGFPFTPRFAVWKGRHNYLCWRALEIQAPILGGDDAEEGEGDDGDSGRAVYAWTRAALFAATDPDGDLDRLPRGTELPFGQGGDGGGSAGRDALERESRALLRRVRAETGCCRIQRDRLTCGAQAARRRAERSHVVITNHALALARQGFFRHAIFDECEHLHDQAHAAWSHVLPFGRMRELLGSLSGAGTSSRARPLDRVGTAALRGSEARACAERCLELREASLDALVHVEQAVAEFKAWRESVRGAREERDEHSLFREYALSSRSGELLEAHALLVAAWNELTGELSALSEHLDHVPVRGRTRLRRSLDLARSDLEELLVGVAAWIPRDDRGPSFRPETFYDVETDPRGRDAMAARVLLPHEYLGRYYFPELSGGVCISATTMLAGSFETASTYLGLHRAAHPREDEAREPTPLATFQAPAPFDYGRVLVAVPRDAPAFQSRTKAAFLDYTREFVRRLGEHTRGRMLVLFTNAADCIACGRALEPWFQERGIPFWYQRMEGVDKEELAELFRSRTDSILFGLDTFWYGADFPGETLEYLVIVKLPYGVPDRYHHAQCAALGVAEQRRTIYMPRALAKFRQGFGRLMRKETDRGCVFVLDGRVLDPRHRSFLRELPLALGYAGEPREGLARFVRGDTEHVLHEALAHMGMLADVRRHEATRERRAPRREEELEGPAEIAEGDVPF